MDAANLRLLLPGADGDCEPFHAGQRAAVAVDSCQGCRLCVEACRFEAISPSEDGSVVVDDIACEGCRVCRAVCPEDAISLRDNLAGHLMVRELGRAGALVHAQLGIAQDNSGKLVAAVRERARAEARRRGIELIIIDGPPGIGCPVHAAITGADLLLAVTEPTPSGAHDLHRLLSLANAFQLPGAVLINKADLSAEYTAEVKRLAAEAEAEVVGCLPFTAELPRALARGEVPLNSTEWGERLRESWPGILALLQERPAAADGGLNG